MHVSGVFTQRTQLSPLTLDVTTNRYFIVQRGTSNIFGIMSAIILSHPPHTHDRYNSPTVQYKFTVHSFQVHGHYSLFLRPWTLFLSRPWTLFLSLSFSRVHSLHQITSLRMWCGTNFNSLHYPLLLKKRQCPHCLLAKTNNQMKSHGITWSTADRDKRSANTFA